MEFHLPVYELKRRADNGNWEIFDPVRKTYIEQTPEELVRQNWMKYLHDNLGVSYNHMVVEREIKFNGRKKRFDLVLVDQEGSPKVLCEFKAPNVRLSQNTFNQAAIYNGIMDCQYLLISNGETHYLAKQSDGEKSWQFLENMPEKFK